MTSGGGGGGLATAQVQLGEARVPHPIAAGAIAPWRQSSGDGLGALGSDGIAW